MRAKAERRGLGSPAKAAFGVGAGIAALMLAFETIKELSFPGLTKWESHILTVLMASFLSGVAGYSVASRFRKANAALRAENAVRRSAEAEARRALDEKEGLLRELQHRAKNSFALISSLIALAKGETVAPEAERSLSETGARVSAIAELYDLLYSTGSAREVELGEYLGRVADSLLDRPRIAFRKELDRGIVGVDEAIPLGLLVTELATNAIKHAFPEGSGGEVLLVARFGERGLELEFSDDGVGMPPGAEGGRAGSLGLSLVKSLAAQLGGTWRLGATCDRATADPRPGAAWSFRFPVFARRSAEG